MVKPAEVVKNQVCKLIRQEAHFFRAQGIMQLQICALTDLGFRI